MLVTLRELLPAAAASGYAVPCFNVFGNEEAVAIVAAAQALERGVILGCNKEMADFMGVEGFLGMVSYAAKSATVPVCIHLDHCDDEARVLQALKAGFSSVMFDGSQLPLAQNISRTAAMAKVAHEYGATIEGEVGSVPYFEGRDHVKSELTSPADAREFAANSGVDAMAIAVGNIHRLREPTALIDFDLLAQIEACTSLPLVIHGTTGITEKDVRQLKQSRISKFNIGTTMRMTFARHLRASLAQDPAAFDRLTIMRPVVAALQAEALRNLLLLGQD